MKSEVYIADYHGIKDLTLTHIKEVNLFTGPNGSGKSRVLHFIKDTEGAQAMYLDPANIEFTFRSIMRQGHDIRKTTEIVGRFFKEVEKVEWWDDTLYITFKGDVVDGSYKISATEAGSGFCTCIYLVTCLLFTEQPYILLDEVFSTIHHSKILKILEWMIFYCQEHERKLFIATHSNEVVDHTLNLTVNNPISVSLYMMSVQKGRVCASRMNKKEAFYYNVYGLDLRGDT